MIKTYNIIIAGVGGQGLITLLQLISKAGLNKGLDVRTSELHGLSQRGGSVSVHIRIGSKVFSPTVPAGMADLALALESQEALNVMSLSSKNTVFLINQYQTPTLDKTVSEKQVMSNLKQVSKKAFLVPATDTCQKMLKSGVVAGVFLLGYAIKHMPLSEADIKRAVKESMPEKFWELNTKAFDLGKNYET